MPIHTFPYNYKFRITNLENLDVLVSRNLDHILDTEVALKLNRLSPRYMLAITQCIYAYSYKCPNLLSNLLNQYWGTVSEMWLAHRTGQYNERLVPWLNIEYCDYYLVLICFIWVQTYLDREDKLLYKSNLILYGLKCIIFRIVHTVRSLVIKLKYKLLV